MAPISLASLELRPRPQVEVRQGPTPYAITLTITRETTTYRSTITLGTDAGGATAAPTNALTTTTTAPAPVQTLAAAPAKTTSDNNGVVIGAILGSFLGLAVLVVLVWKCCYDPRSVLWRPSEDYDDGSDYMTASERSSRSSGVRRVRRRGGDAEYERRVRRGHGVRRPSRAYMRREREGSLGGESWGTWRGEKRRIRGGMVVRNGMAGWAFGGGGGRRKSSGRRDWVEREEVRMRFSTDD